MFRSCIALPCQNALDVLLPGFTIYQKSKTFEKLSPPHNYSFFRLKRPRHLVLLYQKSAPGILLFAGCFNFKLRFILEVCHQDKDTIICNSEIFKNHALRKKEIVKEQVLCCCFLSVIRHPSTGSPVIVYCYFCLSELERVILYHSRDTFSLPSSVKYQYKPHISYFLQLLNLSPTCVHSSCDSTSCLYKVSDSFNKL